MVLHGLRRASLQRLFRVIKGDCTLLDRERFGRWKSAGKVRGSRPSRVVSEGGDLAGGTVGCQRNWRWGQCWREFLPRWIDAGLMKWEATKYWSGRFDAVALFP